MRCARVNYSPRKGGEGRYHPHTCRACGPPAEASPPREVLEVTPGLVAEMRRELLARAPRWPLCGDTVAQAGAGYRRPAEEATRHTHWQPNPRGRTGTIVCDSDEADPLASALAGRAPTPNALVWNLRTEHAHALYLLAEPVGRGGNSSRRAVSYLDAVWHGLERALGADLNYTRLLSRGPDAPGHQLEVLHVRPYQLGELAQRVPMTGAGTERRRQAAQNADSRNCALFYDLTQLGRRHGTAPDLLQLLEAQAAEFQRLLAQNHPRGQLPASEVRATVRSVYNYRRAHPTATRPQPSTVDRSSLHSWERGPALPPGEIRARQAAAGRESAAQRREATRAEIQAAAAILSQDGQPVTLAVLEAVTGLSRSTLIRNRDLFR